MRKTGAWAQVALPGLLGRGVAPTLRHEAHWGFPRRLPI